MSGLKLPLIFQDSMVLQRRKAICVWGEAQDGEQVRVTLGGHTALGESSGGRWEVYLPPMEAATGLTLTVSADGETIALKDVAVGEVWIAGGQSNMEFLLKYDADRESACRLTNPDIRCFEVPKISFPDQERYYKMSEADFWRKEDPENSPFFTAVGFYFAGRIWEELRVPVGIINCTWGGTSASCWVSQEYLTGELQFYLDNALKVQSAVDPDELLPRYVEMQRKMLSSDIDMGRPNLQPLEPLIDEATHQRLMTMNNWPLSPFRPCGLFHLMVQTIVPYTVSGVIWYQGESDEYFSPHYESAMRAVLNCWRDCWRETLPFLMVQLASFEVMAEYLDFVSIRATQERLAQTERAVYLVTAMDLGMRYDIHPKEKGPVGRRLALQALDKVYHCHIPADSPTVRGALRQGDTVTVKLRHTGDGLYVRGDRAETFDITAAGVVVRDFTVSVCGDELVIHAQAFADPGPVEIRFCQRPWCELTVYNSHDLPVLPFTLRIE